MICTGCFVIMSNLKLAEEKKSKNLMHIMHFDTHES